MELERKVGYTRGRGTHFMHCLTLKNEIKDAQMQEIMATQENESPKLFVFANEKQVELITLAADTLIIQLQDCDVIYGILALVASYFVFSVSYPKSYSQQLGLLEQLLLKEKFLERKSAGFMSMAKFFKG
jgi:hypothetical protein